MAVICKLNAGETQASGGDDRFDIGLRQQALIKASLSTREVQELCLPPFGEKCVRREGGGDTGEFGRWTDMRR